MKLTIGAYEAEVKAKHTLNERYSKEWACSFLNELSLVYSEAAKYNGMIGFYGTEKDYNKKSDEIYRFLKELGVYD